ncbi:tail fiber protein [Flavobacterium limi]|uniref:Uncharacterized protein n=1 Tax=Flavobacterium limi TaxID=2045105 RepID=A0ABQ1TWV8_9FLAO|nr:tail fiber protein [Flavobacterium limi]GGF04028.1 hypothetical protein GCM10011518_11530 [Flavobacterium limi]
MKQKLYFLSLILFTIHTSSQIISPNGDNIFYYNGSADVTFKFPPRGSGGRAFVHADGNILSLNFGNDFSGGVKIGNDVFFKDGGNSFINSGNFGIGTYIPLTKLDVRGTISVWGQNPGNTEDHGQIIFENSNHGIRRIGNIVDVFTSGGAESGITFTPRSYNSTTNSYSNMVPAMKISANGNVGIGTSTPEAKLHVKGDLQNNGDILLGHTGETNYLTSREVDQVLGIRGSNFIKFGTYNGDWKDRMIINNIGNIGIGTTTPTGILELQKLNSNLVFDLNTNGLCKIISKGWNANIDIHTFQTSGAENLNQLYLNTNGHVGIGTNTTDSKLTVAGNIHAQEVKVTANAGTVPDYVFANDYKLKTLQEVEAYIKQNSHLPEIPSAKEIEKNGLMLAEMNMSLLKKIEELTLYSIEQNKKIESQSKEIETLKDLVVRVTNIEKELAKK